MAKRYTREDDCYIIAFYCPALASNIAEDIGRSEASIKARVKKRKECGAWRVRLLIRAYEMQCDLLAGHNSTDEGQYIADLELIDLDKQIEAMK